MAPGVAGTDLYTDIKHMAFTTGVSYGLTLIIEKDLNDPKYIVMSKPATTGEEAIRKMIPQSHLRTDGHGNRGGHTRDREDGRGPQESPGPTAGGSYRHNTA